ncbi:MAG: hypothetical protein RR547_08570, partial [Raoultibacter sp.]
MNTSTITKVTREWLKTMGYISLWVLGVALLIYALQENSFLQKDSSWPLLIFNSFTAPFFFLIMGIVLPKRHTKRFLNLGVTRKQYLFGMIIAVFIAAVVTALFFALNYLGTTWHTADPLRLEYISQQFIIDVTNLVLFYLFGLLVTISFASRNILIAAAGLLVAYGGLTFATKLATLNDAWGNTWSSSYWTLGLGFSWEINPQLYLVMPFPLYIAAIVLFIAAAVGITYFLSKKIVI